jgi:hypothetical protein
MGEIGFIVTGGEAVPIVTGILSSVVNVLDYTAGNGVTDDTAGFAAATAAAAGGMLFVGKGTYNLNGTIFIPANTRVVGCGGGSVIINNYGFYIQAVNNVSVEYLTIAMKSPTSLTNSFQAISILNGCSNITIAHCHLSGFSQYGIVIGDAGSAGLDNDIRILNNIVDATGMAVGNLANGPIGIECFPKSITPSFTVSPGLIIEGNTVLGNPGCIYAGIKTSYNHGIRVANNFVSGISSPNPEGGIDLNACSGIVCTGNVVDNCSIGIDVGSLTDAGLTTTSSENIVSDNIITSFGYAGIYANLGLNGLVISGNHITLGSGAGSHGVWLGHVCWRGRRSGHP